MPLLGVYGYDAVEPVILAALVTEDPLLLVGASGTGKTFLLNSLSEALGLDHRHYNASLISFDDLVGFPYPQPDGSGIKYLQTPATVWGAESLLVDELNRCRPEHQNRFFSLIQERRLQGLPLTKLRYRWAAMNPPALDDEAGYLGCEALDQALADRFAFVLTVADWRDLSEADRRLIVDPRGDGAVSSDGGQLVQFLAAARAEFEVRVKDPCPWILDYARLVTSALLDGGVRLSPRRSRQLAKNLIALSVVTRIPREAQFRLGLRWSLPQRATGGNIDEAILAAAHQVAWAGLQLGGPDRWLFDFHRLTDLGQIADSLLFRCPNPEIGSVAVAEFMAYQPMERSLALALGVTPALLARPEPALGIDGLHALAQLAAETIHVEGVRRWYDSKVKFSEVDPARITQHGTRRYVNTVHPDWTELSRLLTGLHQGRRRRAEALFGALFHRRIRLPDPKGLEDQFHRACEVAASFVALGQRPQSTGPGQSIRRRSNKPGKASHGTTPR